MIKKLNFYFYKRLTGKVPSNHYKATPYYQKLRSSLIAAFTDKREFMLESTIFYQVL